ncbi:MAG: DUF1579 domain-containing protein [Pseudomonadota bacterium]
MRGKPTTAVTLLALALALGAGGASAQGRPDPAALMKAQREALAPLVKLDGVWRGPATTVTPAGTHSITQTERIGPFLDGSVKVLEGRGYDADGKVTFNAFGTISFNPATKAYTMHSHAMGNVGDFALTVTADGFSWELPAGPATIRYTTSIKDGVWHEVGDRIVTGKDPQRFFEMTLKRVGDTDWPAAGAIAPK